MVPPGPPDLLSMLASLGGWGWCMQPPWSSPEPGKAQEIWSEFESATRNPACLGAQPKTPTYFSLPSILTQHHFLRHKWARRRKRSVLGIDGVLVSQNVTASQSFRRLVKNVLPGLSQDLPRPSLWLGPELYISNKCPVTLRLEFEKQWAQVKVYSWFAGSPACPLPIGSALPTTP